MKFSGPSSGEAAQSRAQHGINVFSPPKRNSWRKEFLPKFENPIIRVLIIAVTISFGVGALERLSFESPGIVVAILLAMGLAFWKERKAGAEFDVLNTSSDDVPVKVMRDGVTTSALKDVVVADVVLLDQGDEVFADERLLYRPSSQVKRRLQELNQDWLRRTRPLLPMGVSHQLPSIGGK